MEILGRLESVAQKVRELECLARIALYEQDDPTAYRNLLYEKAELLMAVGDLADEFCLPDDVAEKLLRFSRNAQQAMELQSIFYMGALLYPDNYRENTPNELELVIQELRAKTV